MSRLNYALLSWSYMVVILPRHQHIQYNGGMYLAAQC